jgi:hypothetical protein
MAIVINKDMTVVRRGGHTQWLCFAAYKEEFLSVYKGMFTCSVMYVRPYGSVYEQL